MNQAAAPSTRKLMKMAEAALQKKRGTEALNLYGQVIQLNPMHAEAHHQVGLILHIAGDNVQARTYLERAIQCDPAHADSYLLLAVIAEAQNNGFEALQLVLHAATHVAPENARAHAAVVGTMLRQHQSHMVVPYLENILPRFPNDQELHEFYCFGLKVAYRFDEAETEYARMCKKWRVPSVFRMLFETYMPRLIRSNEQIDRTREDLEKAIERFMSEKPRIDPNTLNLHPVFGLAYHDRDNKELIQRFNAMLRLCMPELNYTAPHAKSSSPPEGKIRIAFVSAHMHKHPVGHCYRGAMIQLAQQPEFDVVFFNLSHVMDEGIQEVINAGIAMPSVPKDVISARKTIESFKPDMVIYPDIGLHIPTHYLAMTRLARYQCCFQGHPETTGIDTIDYFISSRTYEPPHAQQNYGETLLCYEGIDTVFKRPTPPARWLSREELQLPSGKKLYVCPMAIQKFHPDFDSLLTQILQADPKAVLVLFSDFDQQGATEILKQRLLQHCDPARVIFLEWQPLERFFSILKAADAILDSIYFGLGTTAQFAFGLGFPIVTMPGRYARGRVVHGYYRTMGIEEAPEADSPAAYVASALRVANDDTYRAKLEEQILSNNAKLFEQVEQSPLVVQLIKDIFAQDIEQYRCN